MFDGRQNPESEGSTQVEAYILAGGVSSRMGREKHLLELAGVPLIHRTIQIVLRLSNKVTVVGPASIALPAGVTCVKDDDYGLPVEPDRSKGPLYGIATALSRAQSSWILILACDLPYLSAEWLGWLLARAARSHAQIVMPYTGQDAQPLAAAYRRECGPGIVQSLHGGVRKVKDALTQFTIEGLLESEWRGGERQSILLKSMNTPSDYDEARRWWLARELPKVGSPLPEQGELSEERPI